MIARLSERAPSTNGPALYGAWVTPRNGAPVYSTVRSSLGLPHVRLEVQRRAIVRYPHGFTFSVRSA
jgi:hypothetical protein